MIHTGLAAVAGGEPLHLVVGTEDRVGRRHLAADVHADARRRHDGHDLPTRRVAAHVDGRQGGRLAPVAVDGEQGAGDVLEGGGDARVATQVARSTRPRLRLRVDVDEAARDGAGHRALAPLLPVLVLGDDVTHDLLAHVRLDGLRAVRLTHRHGLKHTTH